eukprot:4513498-Prymnesium_polylepis.1
MWSTSGAHSEHGAEHRGHVRIRQIFSVFSVTSVHRHSINGMPVGAAASHANAPRRSQGVGSRSHEGYEVNAERGTL